MRWKFLNIEPSMDDDISITYESSKRKVTQLRTMAKLSRFIVKKGYDEIMEYVRTLEDDEM